MNVTAEDGTSHQFPDNVPPSLVKKAMDQYATAHPKPNMWADVGKSAATGLVKGGTALAGIPGDLQAILNRGADWLTGVPSGTAAQSMDQIPGSADINAALSKASGGYHVPQTTAGRYAETIASFAPAAVGGEASLPMRLARVAIPGAASEAAGEATQGTSLEPYARGAGAIAGAVGVASAPRAIRSIMGAANNAVASVTGGPGFLNPDIQAGRQLARSISAGPGGAAGAIARAAQYKPVGASNPTAVDVGGNQTLRLVRAAAQASEGDAQDIAQSYADKVRAALPDQMIARTTALTPDRRAASDVSASIERARGQQASADYAAPYAQPATVTKEMVSALQGPEGRGAIARAYAAARANRDVQQMGELKDLQEVASEQGATPDPLTGRKRTLSDALSNVSAGSLDRVRIAMRDIGGNLYQRGARDIARGYRGRVQDIDTALDQTPGLQQARGAYRASSADQEAVALGQSGMNTPSSDYASQLADLASQSPNARANAGIGYRQAMTDAIGRQRAGATGQALTLATAPEQTTKLIATFGAKDAGDFQKALQLEIGRMRNANALPPGAGSQTALRQMDVSAFPLYTPTGAMFYLARQLMRGTMTPAERAAIVRMGTDPDKIQALLAQAAKVRRPGLHGPATAAAIGFNQQANP